MSAMVERVARAWREERKLWDIREAGDGTEIIRRDHVEASLFVVMARVGWREVDALFVSLRDNACARAAIAAIAAMREPTKAIVQAMSRENTEHFGSYSHDGSDDEAAMWDAAIDAALAESLSPDPGC